MIRISRTIAVAVLSFAIPAAASALGIQIVNVSSTGASTSYLQAGDEITFDLHLENNSNAAVGGLDIVVSGIDEPGFSSAVSSGLTLIGGVVAPSILNTEWDGSGDVDGMGNFRSAPVNEWALNLFNPQPVRTSLFAGVLFNASVNGNGTFDRDIFGNQTGPNGIHFRVTYRLVAPAGPAQNLTLSFGTLPAFGNQALDQNGNQIPFQNATWALTVVPEPGTALLMGLGLAALAGRRR